MTIAVSSQFVMTFNIAFVLLFAGCAGIVIWSLGRAIRDLLVIRTPEAKARLCQKVRDQARLWRLGTVAMELVTLTALVVFLVVGLQGHGPPASAVPLQDLLRQFTLEFAILLLAVRSAIFQYVLNRVGRVR